MLRHALCVPALLKSTAVYNLAKALDDPLTHSHSRPAGALPVPAMYPWQSEDSVLVLIYIICQYKAEWLFQSYIFKNIQNNV